MGLSNGVYLLSKFLPGKSEENRAVLAAMLFRCHRPTHICCAAAVVQEV